MGRIAEAWGGQRKGVRETGSFLSGSWGVSHGWPGSCLLWGKSWQGPAVLVGSAGQEKGRQLASEESEESGAGTASCSCSLSAHQHASLLWGLIAGPPPLTISGTLGGPQTPGPVAPSPYPTVSWSSVTRVPIADFPAADPCPPCPWGPGLAVVRLGHRPSFQLGPECLAVSLALWRPAVSSQCSLVYP